MSGYLRFLYEEILECSSEDVWQNVFLRHWPEFREVRRYYQEINLRKCHKWPAVSSDELWNFYSVSRVNDVMLLGFQDGHCDGSDYKGPNITIENYLEFFAEIGFSKRDIRTYHPFYCEIVDVIETSDDDISIEKIIWPALILGNMLLSRAGVILRVPQTQFAMMKIAGKSILYWSFRRKYRKTRDLSMGWGSNSQWRTSFRRDYELGDLYAYNVDGHKNLNDLASSVNVTGRGINPSGLTSSGSNDPMADMNINGRVDFLKCRYAIWQNIDDADLWPYDDSYEERKG